MEVVEEKTPEKCSWEHEILQRLAKENRRAKKMRGLTCWTLSVLKGLKSLDHWLTRWMMQRKSLMNILFQVLIGLMLLILGKRIVRLLVSLFLWTCLLTGIVFVITMIRDIIFSKRRDERATPRTTKTTWLRDAILSNQLERLPHILLSDNDISSDSYRNSVLKLSSGSLRRVMLTMLNLCRRDFIESWYYGSITERDKDSTFPFRCQRLAEQGINRLVERSLSNFNPKLWMQDAFMPLLVAHVDVMRMAEKKLRARLPTSSVHLTQSDALHRLIAECYRQATEESLRQSSIGISSLIALSTVKSVQRMIEARNRVPLSRSIELKFLRSRVDGILVYLFPKREIESMTVRYLFREVLVCKLLMPAMEFLADPDTINRFLLDIVSKQLENKNLLRKLQEQLREVLEIPEEKEEDLYDSSTISVQKIRSFEGFLNHISRCDDLVEAKALYQQIIVEVKRKNAQLNDTKASGNLSLKQMDETRRYVNQLLVAKKKIEKKITTLSGGSISMPLLSESDLLDSEYRVVLLRDILDSQTGLFHFAEFVETNFEMRKLQFWLGVESNRQHFYSENRDLQALREDFSSLFQNFLGSSEKASQIGISETFREIIEGKIKAGLEESADFIPFFIAQDEIFKFIERNYYPKFLRSEGYFRFLEESSKLKNQSHRSNYVSNSHSVPTNRQGIDENLTDHPSFIMTDSRDSQSVSPASNIDLLETRGEGGLINAEKEFEAGTMTSDRMTIKISAFTSMIQDGKKYVLYVIEIHIDGFEAYSSGWVVLRRFNEFHQLHKNLSALYSSVKEIKFPSRHVMLLDKADVAFLNQRRIDLEHYLNLILRTPDIISSEDIRQFLSRKVSPYVGATPSTKPSGIPTMASTLNTVDAETTKSTGLTGSIAASSALTGSEDADESIVASMASMSPDIVGSLCELLDIVYDLRDNYRFRRQAILILLQQFLYASIERRMTESFSYLLSENQLCRYLEGIRDAIWPVYDKARDTYVRSEQAQPPRSMKQQQTTREETEQKLSQLMIDILGGFLGKDSVRQGTVRMFASLQNKYLNKHLLFSLFEEWINVLFPEAHFEPLS